MPVCGDPPQQKQARSAWILLALLCAILEQMCIAEISFHQLLQ